MKLRQYIAGFAALAALTSVTTACQDDIDAPAMEVPVAKSTPNTTIAELKARYWQEADNYAATIGNADNPEERTVIHGRVVSSDEASNVFKSLVIQDETAALAFSINSYNLYLNYRVGQEIVMDVTGMEIGKYSGLMQMGSKSWYERGNTWQISFMAPEYFSSHAELNGVPDAAKVDTIQVPSFSYIGTSPEEQQKWQSQLVCLQNVSFQEGGQAVFSSYHSSGENRVITDANGNTMNVRTSGYSTFWNTTLPEGNVDLTGILSFFNNAWQFILIDGNAWKASPERPGAKDNPYSVDEAVQAQIDGITAQGWVKGYIVGAVAPGVEDITSADDIEWEAPTVLANTLVIGQTPETRTLDHALVIYLTSESAFEQYGNLRDNPTNLGKEILVHGTLAKYLGTYGITGNNGSTSTFEIEGVEVGGGEIAAGAGSQDSPYNVAQVVALNPGSTTTAVESGIWVKGYIVGSMPTGGSSTTLAGTSFGLTDAATTNIVIGPTADCTDPSKCVGVQLPTGTIRNALNLSANPGNLGKVVALKGDVMKYCGGPGIKNTSEYVLDGSTTPDVPAGTPEGDGTAASPYNSVKALEVAKALASGATTDADVYVKGKVSSIKELSTSFGNATYSITSEGTNVAFDIFRGYYFNGDKFTSEDQLKVGDEVVVCGKLTNYMGNTPQMAQGGKIISINGQGSGDTPVTPGDVTAEGDGSESSPYNTVALRALNPTSTTVAVASGVWLKGYIVGSMPTGGSSTTLTGTSFGTADAATTNIVVGPTPDCKDVNLCVGIQLPTGDIRNALNLSANPGNLGRAVTLKGDVMKYCGGPGLKNTSAYTLGEGGTTPDNPDKPDVPDTPDVPVNPGEAVNIAISQIADVISAPVTVSGYTFTADKASGATAPAINGTTLRLYADNTFTIAGASMAKIVFTLNTSTGSKRYTTFTPNTGTVTEQKSDDTAITWTGSATSVTFTVGHDATLGSDGASKRGQVHISDIAVYPAN